MAVHLTMENLLLQLGINYNGDKRQIMTLTVGAEAFLALPLTICCFVVAGTANAGFNAVLTALLNIAFIAGSYYVVNNSKTPIAIGFLIGASVMIMLLNFMTSVYWGQLSKCQVVTSSVAQYSCSNPDAYGAVCAFSVMMFLANVVFTTLIIMWRGELISDVGAFEPYDNLPTSSSHGPYDTPQKGPAQSADL